MRRNLLTLLLYGGDFIRGRRSLLVGSLVALFTAGLFLVGAGALPAVLVLVPPYLFCGLAALEWSGAAPVGFIHSAAVILNGFLYAAGSYAASSSRKYSKARRIVIFAAIVWALPFAFALVLRVSAA